MTGTHSVADRLMAAASGRTEHPGVVKNLMREAAARITSLESHVGELPSRDRILKAHSRLPAEWAGFQAPQHMAYKQASAEQCYICALLAMLGAARDALIRCAELTGEDGECVAAARSGAMTYPSIEVWAVECVRQLRDDYDEELS